ncbi:MAG: hypothetical protein ACYDGY_10560 [Acidimicrobiales bacterium]
MSVFSIGIPISIDNRLISFYRPMVMKMLIYPQNPIALPNQLASSQSLATESVPVAFVGLEASEPSLTCVLEYESCTTGQPASPGTSMRPLSGSEVKRFSDIFSASPILRAQGHIASAIERFADDVEIRSGMGAQQPLADWED